MINLSYKNTKEQKYKIKIQNKNTKEQKINMSSIQRKIYLSYLIKLSDKLTKDFCLKFEKTIFDFCKNEIQI